MTLLSPRRLPQLIKAVTGEVKLVRIPLSGNATLQDLDNRSHGQIYRMIAWEHLTERKIFVISVCGTFPNRQRLVLLAFVL